MSTKKRYNLTCFVATVRELVKGKEKTHVQKSIYGIQTVQPYTQFTQVNPTGFGFSSTENFSDEGSSFVLFGLDDVSNQNLFHSLVYNSTWELIGTPEVHSIAIILPKVKHGVDEIDMEPFVPGVICGLKAAMNDCTSVIKSQHHKLYFLVPEGMKEPLRLALEEVE